MKEKFLDFIYSIINGIKNIVYWFPVMWNDRSYDYYYIYKMLYYKIKKTRKHFEKYKIFVGQENCVKWMKICEKLIDDIMNEKYEDKSYDNVYLNLRNMNLSDFEEFLCSELYAEEDTPFYKKGEDLGAIHRAHYRTIKAKNLLFKILSWQIDYWWL